jgi:UDP-N-acetylmuramate dehydrogenase
MNTRSLRGQLLESEPLSVYNTWRVGGQAKRLYKPADMDDLVVFLQGCPVTEPLLWLGLGSNSLIKDTGFSGTVVVTQGYLNKLELVSETEVFVEAGVSCAKMARFCARNNLIGGEFWAGIPGTIGGALRMNAGCFHGETWQSVVEVNTVNRFGEIRRRGPETFNIGYRHVAGLEPDEWFLNATCRFVPGDKEKSLQMIHELLARRAATQPTSEYNCGSVFRNPPDGFAAKLIESCQLKGKQIGGAMVSEKHANFIINHQGRASADDIENLIQFVQKTVYDKTNTSLIREVHILGDA